MSGAPMTQANLPHNAIEILRPDWVRAQVRTLLAEPDAQLEDDDHLIELGLDSLQLMRLVNQWRKVGADVSFAQLIEQPRLCDWWPLLSRQRTQENTAGVETRRLADDPTPFVLTDVQHAYWIGRGDEQVLGGVGCHAYLELGSRNIDPSRLENAWGGLLARHGMLRARFDGQGRQSIGPVPAESTRQIQVYDLRQQTGEAVERTLAEIREQRSHRRLRIDEGEVAGLALSLLPNENSRLHFDIDLLVADVQSLHVILRDLAALYAQDELPDTPIDWHFGHHLDARARQHAGLQEEAGRYWKERLEDFPGAPTLPLHCAPETVVSPHFTRRVHEMSAPRWARLQRFAASARITPAMVLATAYAEVLGAWSATPRFLLNLPLFDRHGDTPGLDDVVADFTNLLLLEADCREAMSFAARARALQARFHADVAHSAWSGVRVQRELAQRGDGERSFAPVVFACNLGTPLLDARARRSLGELEYMISQTPQVWLDHQVYEQDGGVLLAWDALDALFPDGLIDDMFGAYVRLLDHLAGDTAAWEQPLPALLPPGQRAVREVVNATDARIAPRTLHRPIFDLAASHPARTALIDPATGQTLDYRSLAHRALQVAALLIERGVRPGDPVAVTLPRGIEQAVAVLGVLAAGACYVPVGIAQPIARQERIHRRAGISQVLTNAIHMRAFDSLVAKPIDISQAAHKEPILTPVPTDPEALAYVIFTSGSTGEPKGVEVSHRAAANTIDDLNQRCGIGPDDRVLAVSALDFDLSVYDLFGLLGAGGAVVLLAEDDRRDASVWLRLVREWRVTLWNSVPVLLDMLLVAAEGDARPLPLRLAMASGDWIGLDLPERLARMAPGARFLSMGGATEAAIWSNLCEVVLPLPDHWRSIPYGRPLANQRYRVVDTQGRDCPDWVTGELWIGGAGVARGYRGDPHRTAESFVEYDGLRWYRTGDLGRYWPDGTLEFLGRRDHQIKLRGHRIELGEVEAALLAQPDVRQAVALLAGQPPALAAALVVEGSLDTGTLASALHNLLPEYMIPTAWLALDALPLSSNGKIDRRELEIKLAATQSPTLYEPPLDSLEQELAALWEEVLGCEKVSRHDDFFQLGGDSLRATRLIEALRRLGPAGASLSLRKVFSAPTVAAQAAWLRTQDPHYDPDINITFEEGTL